MCLRYVSIRRVCVSVRWCWCKGQYCQPALNSARRGLVAGIRRAAWRVFEKKFDPPRAGRAAGSARNFTVLRVPLRLARREADVGPGAPRRASHMAMAKGQGGHGAWPMPCSMSRASVPHRACDVWMGRCMGPWAMAPRPCAGRVHCTVCWAANLCCSARARGEMNLRLSGLQSENYERVGATLASKHKYFYVISSCLVCREMNVA